MYNKIALFEQRSNLMNSISKIESSLNCDD